MAMPLFAHGKGDIEDLKVENLNSWQEQFDLDSRKPGKYNIMITARDLGGNTYIEGPHNIFLDPNSDLPICGITNPYPGMRVVGNLNIVGTCVDDDGVSKVELILDEGTDIEQRVVAEGKEFWSYYLDTTNLEEGDHTIKVIGYDINEVPVVGKPVTLTWQLDRKQPVTEVLDKSMGLLVSGNVKFDGVVSDGNGIKELFYSVDNGKNFTPVKISPNKTKDACTFSVNVDTRKFSDGPAVLWFKAVDKATSVGMYSFLYFIDNTKPDVQIVYPADDQVMNGKFTVAGFAKDKIGITELSWAFGNQNGNFELIPGNPYWAVTLNTLNGKEKSQKFTIHAVDRAGNVVDVSKTINLDQELDKPLVTTSEPVEGQLYGDTDRLYVRGLATDDDGVKAVKIQLDNREAIVQETKGVYYLDLCGAEELSAGPHKLTITAIDVNDVEGNPYVTNIVSKGIAPTFSDAKLSTGKDVIDFANGLSIHPESGSSISVTANSGVGLTNIHTELTWGSDGLVESDVELKAQSSYTVTLPINPDSPKGVMKFTVRAKDAIERESEYKALFYVTNTGVVKAEEPILVFDDSTVAEDGSIICNAEFPATGYLIGGSAQSVEIYPTTPFAKAELVGNQIRLVPRMDSLGSSEEVKVRVRTTKGKIIESRPIIFKNDTALPVIGVDGYSDITAINLNELEDGIVKVTGKVTCATGLGPVKYRLLSAVADIQKGVIASVKPAPIEENYTDIEIAKDGTYTFEIDSNIFDYGMYVVEIVAESAGGNKSCRGFALSKIPELEELENGKMPVAKPPVVTWLDGGFDVYALGVYQGNLDRTFAVFSREEMIEGNNPLQMDVTTDEGKIISGKYTAAKLPSLSANIALVNDQEYMSGMPVVLDYATKAGGSIFVYIDTGAPLSSVNYEFSGAEIAGGDVLQKGAAKLVKPGEENPLRWVAEIPLANLPSRVNNLTITIKAGALEKTIKGSITVIRNIDPTLVDDAEKVYAMPDAATAYDEVEKNYILTNGSKFYYYANVSGPISAEFASGGSGLLLETIGNLVVLTAEKDGIYKNVVVKIKDRMNDSYNSESLNFVASNAGPELVLQTPELFQWVGNSFKLSGTAAHQLGVKSVEYSLDGGESWESFTIPSGKNANNLGVTFSKEINISEKEEGLIRINIRATAISGHVTNVLTSVYKDITPPEVKVVEPLDIDVVNGENLVVFEVRDNGFLAKGKYVAPPVKGKAKTEIDIPLEPLPSMLVGTEEAPIDDAMSFVFTDDAGNSTTVESWAFSIDNESDLPRAEIHVPEDMQVITRDFTISGVVYDDDGESSIYYKIDDGQYKQVSTKEVFGKKDPAAEYVLNTSFSIDVPLETMVDNEHTVTVYAVDINGVKGPEVSRTYRISLEEPKGAVELPTIDTSVREIVTISGWASDKNGIEKVEVSLDNGNTYNDAVGTENWKYVVDTRAIPGGTQVVFLRVTDKYGITGLYSSLINIDNDAPELNLELPLDDSSTTGQLFFSGFTYDNVEVTDLFVTIRNLEKSNSATVRKIKIDRIIGETLDIRDLPDGFYNVELTGKDKAGNTTNVSRNIHLEKNKAPATVDILYPLNGEHKQGVFTIYGQSEAEGTIASLKLYIDGQFNQETTITDCGFFKFDMTPENITEGKHTYRVDTILTNGTQVASREQTITYTSTGPWVTIENFTYGDFATGRPYIRGQAGYSISEDELLLSKTKEATPEFKAAVAAKKVEKIEISFDNGKTFNLLSTNEKWMYRIENQDMPEGYHFFLIRATMKNGETAITRTIIQIDNTNPMIRLIAPSIGGRYNQKLNVSGLSNDDVKLEDVTVTLRKGDKASYEVPSFIQGLYIDFRLWGATLFSVGAGLTFFDDVVKVQVSYGQFTQSQRDAVSNLLKVNLTNMRYGGNVISLKILANIAEIPFSYFFGHDWDWLYASAAVGADFSYFTETNSGKPQILSAILGQLEFPKVKLQNVKAFSTFSLYVEGALWFIPTDVSSTQDIKNLIPQIGLGFRTNIF
ncbi:MAG: hypothetical protein K6C97_03395 [Treponema sp.]|nr:hypothetical protein [Treponema sp.]